MNRRGYVNGCESEIQPALVEACVEHAYEAVKTTRKTSLHDRASTLEKIAGALRGATTPLARQLAEDSGFLTEHDMRLEVQRAAEVFRLTAAYTLAGWSTALDLDSVERARGAFGIVRREPIGAVLGICAFNGPLLIPAHKLAPAIAAGTSIILKPAPGAARASVDLGKMAVNAGWPAAAVAVLDVDNDTTMKLVRDPRLPVISFTGGRVGWTIKEAAPRKHVQLELGGVGAVLVAADANLEQAARECAAGAFVRSGQSCISVQRIYAARSIFPELVSLLVDAVRELQATHPIGPLVHEEACSWIERLVQDAVDGGAQLVHGGSRAGAYFEPTVLTETTSQMKVMQEEAFGPVVAVNPYDLIEEAISEINSVGGAIHHGIYTADLDVAFGAADAIQAGGVIINGPCTWRADHMPYGGVGQAGFGREGIAHSVLHFTEPKVIVVRPSRSR
ncbi:aldehyde dehydrogenase family protein [Polaromonas sp.]|uniref:aldehyde dehydrogenase family protein n=1 Tax=Polaromonas sp. TaxID=1869339 RepID=UPI0018215D99|nr:aldehyde dehydrogenase family protein [Polaromonas sp.]NMM06758.1 aldehyde dehydrogenase family protein [Polaromonas sp.]